MFSLSHTVSFSTTTITIISMSASGVTAAARNLAFLRAGPRLLLPSSVSSVRVHYQRKGPGMSGVRSFLKQEVPRLKYTNPEVTFERHIAKEGGAYVVVARRKFSFSNITIY